MVIEYLRNHTFRELEVDHGVDSRPAVSGKKFSLNYDQISAKKGATISDQCRGLIIAPLTPFILDGTDSWKDRVVGACSVVARPMDRFYNHGDTCTFNVDMTSKSTRVFEKLDGTMCILYYDFEEEGWFVGTRAVCEADLPIRKDDIQIGDMTFSDLFWEAVSNTIGLGALEKDDKARETYRWSLTLDRCLTYVFELTSPHNRVVVKYDEPRVTLLAVRHTQSGEENDISIVKVPNIPRPLSWDFASAGALEAFVDAADPANLEGAVACDTSIQPFGRMKVKNKSWVLSSRAKDLVTVSRRSALSAILLGQLDDVIPLVDEDTRQKLEALMDATRRFFLQIDVDFARLKSESGGERKSFAILVNGAGVWHPPFFRMFQDGVSSSRQWAVSSLESGKLTSTSLDAILSRLDIKPQ